MGLFNSHKLLKILLSVRVLIKGIGFADKLPVLECLSFQIYFHKEPGSNICNIPDGGNDMIRNEWN